MLKGRQKDAVVDRLGVRNDLGISKALASLKSFKTDGSLVGIKGKPDNLGLLEGPWKEVWLVQEDDILYTVTSVQTPLAWLADDVWMFPQIFRGRITAKNMATVRRALRRIGATISIDLPYYAQDNYPTTRRPPNEGQ